VLIKDCGILGFGENLPTEQLQKHFGITAQVVVSVATM
jgi:hypothetical protein